MTIRDIYQTMEDGPAPTPDTPAQTWLESHDRAFGQFINGAFSAPGPGFATRAPASGRDLAQITQARPDQITDAIAAARKAQRGWARLSGPQRARHLHRLAHALQKHAGLLAVVQSLDSGRPIRAGQDIDLPQALRQFRHHAGLAHLLDSDLPGHAPLGVCGVILPWTLPVQMLARHIAPALAAGNSVVVKPSRHTPLAALLFGQICREAGLPKGVVTILTGDHTVGAQIVADPGIDAIAFTGKTGTGRQIRRATAGSGKALMLALGGNSPAIVFDDADLDSAATALVETFCLGHGQLCHAGARILIQEGAAPRFLTLLKRRMAGLRLGDPLDIRTDVGAIADPAHLQTLTRQIQENTAGAVWHAPAPPLPEGVFPPVLVSGLAPADALMQAEPLGPVLRCIPFRTADEAVEIANHSRYGLAASIWTENVSRALDVAARVRAGTVWINAANLFDAAATIGATRESGFGDGGLHAYLRPQGRLKPAKSLAAFAGPAGAAPQDAGPDARLYIGGAFTRPAGGGSRPVWPRQGACPGHVALGNAADIDSAAAAARAAHGWASAPAQSRAQVLYGLAQALEARADDFIPLLRKPREAEGEVAAAIARLFAYAAWAESFHGTTRALPIRGAALTLNQPLGVIGALCPDAVPLLGLISLMAPAIALGNRCVLVPSAPFPLAAMEFSRLLAASDLPAGVVNIVTGPQQDLAGALAGHTDVDALWCFAAGLAPLVERESAGNLKRVWGDAQARDWMGAEGEGPAFLRAASTVKTLWLPWGE